MIGVGVSDTHTREYKVPEAHFLVHGGDLTFRGTTQEVANAFYDLKHQPVKHKIIVPGNHDWLAQRDRTVWDNLCEDFGIISLIDSGVVLDPDGNCYPWDPYKPMDGIKIWGAPWQPWFYDWAFNLQRGEEIRRKWEMIPEGTDILITHGPPHGILDEVPDRDIGSMGGWSDADLATYEHVGCWDLKDIIQRKIKPQFHVFGHIHRGYGELKVNETTYLNASLCNEQYRIANKPHVFEVFQRS